MASEKPEPLVDIEMLFVKLTDAFTDAALHLEDTFEQPEWRDSPYVYQMPKMHMKLQLSLAFSNEKVKGFFTKSAAGREEQVSSTLEMDVVAVPRQKDREARILHMHRRPPLMQGSDVRALQSRLADVGCECDVTGVFDLETKLAVEHFQRREKLHVDGIVGPKTREKLAPRKDA